MRISFRKGGALSWAFRQLCSVNEEEGEQNTRRQQGALWKVSHSVPAGKAGGGGWRVVWNHVTNRLPL